MCSTLQSCLSMVAGIVCSCVSALLNTSLWTLVQSSYPVDWQVFVIYRWINPTICTLPQETYARDYHRGTKIKRFVARLANNAVTKSMSVLLWFLPRNAQANCVLCINYTRVRLNLGLVEMHWGEGMSESGLISMHRLLVSLVSFQVHIPSQQVDCTLLATYKTTCLCFLFFFYPFCPFVHFEIHNLIFIQISKIP